MPDLRFKSVILVIVAVCGLVAGFLHPQFYNTFCFPKVLQ